MISRKICFTKVRLGNLRTMIVLKANDTLETILDTKDREGVNDVFDEIDIGIKLVRSSRSFIQPNYFCSTMTAKAEDTLEQILDTKTSENVRCNSNVVLFVIGDKGIKNVQK